MTRELGPGKHATYEPLPDDGNTFTVPVQALTYPDLGTECWIATAPGLYHGTITALAMYDTGQFYVTVAQGDVEARVGLKLNHPVRMVRR